MKRYLYLLALGALLCGCGERGGDVSGADASGNGDQPAAEKRRKSRYPVDNLEPETVIAVVNGSPVLQSDYAEWYGLRDAIFRASNGIEPDIRTDKTTAFDNDSRMHVPVELIRRELTRQEAERLGVEVSEKALARYEKRFMRMIRRPQTEFSDESIGRIFGPENVAAVRSVVYNEALGDLTLAKAATNDLAKVSDEAIDERIRLVKEWNERAEATNAVQRARAAQAKEEILNGGIFAVVASNRSDKAQIEGTKWTLADIPEAMDESEAFGTFLAGADVGDVSDPIELDDGLSVIGVLRIYDEDEAEPGEAPQRQYELVRCVFDVYETIDADPEDRKAIADDILAERKSLASRELGERLVATAKVEFPLGEQIFLPKAKKQKNAAKGAAKGGKKGKPGKKKAQETPAAPENAAAPAEAGKGGAE